MPPHNRKWFAPDPAPPAPNADIGSYYNRIEEKRKALYERIRAETDAAKRRALEREYEIVANTGD